MVGFMIGTATRVGSPGDTFGSGNDSQPKPQAPPDGPCMLLASQNLELKCDKR